MKTTDYDVIDKHGRLVKRSGIVQDGDRVTVHMSMMDASHALALATSQLEQHQLSTFADAVNSGKSLLDAIALAKQVKRIEQFDATHVGHKPGFLGVIDSATHAERERLRDERNAALSDRWRKPLPIVDPAATPSSISSSQDKLIAQRDQRISEAWRRP